MRINRDLKEEFEWMLIEFVSLHDSAATLGSNMRKVVQIAVLQQLIRK